MKNRDVDILVHEMIAGDERAAARLISLVENEDKGRDIIPLIHNKEHTSYTIGITGPPGVGKSTLTEKLVMQLLNPKIKIGILAIDPTSPFTGGAILGDRIRLQQLTSNPQVFIRSMASRGYLGGISAATLDAAKILEAFGCDYIVIETVGVGQSEVEIVEHVDTTILTLAPGMGDDIQALKAGIMEIADIFVVNKADKGGLEKTVYEIEMLLRQSECNEFTPPIVETIATENKGIEELVRRIQLHREFLAQSGDLVIKRKRRIKFELWHRISSTISLHIGNSFANEKIEQLIDDIFTKKTDSYSVAEAIIERIITRYKCNI